MRGGLVLALAIEFKPHSLDLAFEILDPPFEFRDGERRQTFTYRHAAGFFGGSRSSRSMSILRVAPWCPLSSLLNAAAAVEMR